MKKMMPAVLCIGAVSFFYIYVCGNSSAQETAVGQVGTKTSSARPASANVGPGYSPAGSGASPYRASASSSSLSSAASQGEPIRSMVKISGNYGMSMGFRTDEFVWKEANGDWQEKNWRYVFHDLDVDTYDPRIFDRYNLEIETDTGTPWNGYCQIVMDPWSFVQVGHETMTNAWGDSVEIDYKGWQNTGYTINQRYRTFFGNVIDVPELKIKGNQVSQATAAPQVRWSPVEPNFTFSPGRTVKMDYILRPVRKLWVEYDQEPLYFKVFPLADQAEALTTDDPLRLSNNHVYWAPSPWLWRFDPGFVMNNAANAQQEAQWNWDEQWFAQDSNLRYLTFLRGISAVWKCEDFASLEITGATPLGYWDYYQNVSSVPIAARFKMNPNEKWTIGSTYTSKYGIAKQELRANNQVIAMDIRYNIAAKTDVYGELAGSLLQIREPDEQNLKQLGDAYKIGVKSKMDINAENSLEWDTSVTYMSRDFSPGLSDYRDTRVDRDWGRHIWFEPISPDNQASRIGDSVDINRITVGANARALLLDNVIDVYLNFRNAHEAYSNKFVENITRAEVTFNATKNIQFKGLGLIRNYHDSLGGFDPIIRNRYTDELYQNNTVQDGQTVNVMTFSGGVKVGLLEDKLTLYGIYEATNDPQDFPRRELYTPQTRGANIPTVDNIRLNRLSYLLYNQDLFNLPNYPFFSMWKGCLIFRPIKDVELRYTHVTNTNQNYAALFDNNHNHDEVAVTFSPWKGVKWTTGYSISNVIDLAKAVDTNGLVRDYASHTNVYSQIIWDFKKDQRLTLQFGETWLVNPEGGVFAPAYYSQTTSVLDTRPIFRVWYEGKF